MEALLGLGVTSPEQASNGLDTDAVAGVVRWAQDQNKRGRPPESGIIVHKLRQGGLVGYGELRGPTEDWWRTWKGREKWIEANVPDVDYDYAETAIISLLQDKQDPTPESVRTRAQELQHDQQAHDEDCRRSVEAQRKRSLGGREGTTKATEDATARERSGVTTGASAASSPSRPPSEQKAAVA